MTNPDMLHAGLLPHHTRWRRLFSSLDFVVVDELHTYRGLFGSQVANVIRRLKRICAFYGSSPTFICASATIANPLELAKRLLEEENVELVERNGAPRGERRLIFYNPPLVNREMGIRRSSMLEARRIAAPWIRAGSQTIVFCRSRLQVEVMLSYLRQDLAPRLDANRRVRGYRAGYLPLHRREIEAGLRAGEITGVVSTNALELGIDIGSLQAAVLVGYPGTIASTLAAAGTSRTPVRIGRGVRRVELSSGPVHRPPSGVLPRARIRKKASSTPTTFSCWRATCRRGSSSCHSKTRNGSAGPTSRSCCRFSKRTAPRHDPPVAGSGAGRPFRRKRSTCAGSSPTTS